MFCLPEGYLRFDLGGGEAGRALLHDEGIDLLCVEVARPDDHHIRKGGVACAIENVSAVRPALRDSRRVSSTRPCTLAWHGAQIVYGVFHSLGLPPHNMGVPQVTCTC